MYGQDSEEKGIKKMMSQTLLTAFFLNVFAAKLRCQSEILSLGIQKLHNKVFVKRIVSKYYQEANRGREMEHTLLIQRGKKEIKEEHKTDGKMEKNIMLGLK